MAVEDGFREPAAREETLLTGLQERGLTTAPERPVSGGAMGLWAALNKIYPEANHPRCRDHRMANMLNKLPKSVQPKSKANFHDIWVAETFNHPLKRFEAKYPETMACLAKDREELLAFYDYPAEHWVHIHTNKLIESTFTIVRLRTNRSQNWGSRATNLLMVFKLLQRAQKRWRHIKAGRQQR